MFKRNRIDRKRAVRRFRSDWAACKNLTVLDARSLAAPVLLAAQWPGIASEFSDSGGNQTGNPFQFQYFNAPTTAYSASAPVSNQAAPFTWNLTPTTGGVISGSSWGTVSNQLTANPASGPANTLNIGIQMDISETITQAQNLQDPVYHAAGAYALSGSVNGTTGAVTQTPIVYSVLNGSVNPPPRTTSPTGR